MATAMKMPTHWLWPLRLPPNGGHRDSGIRSRWRDVFMSRTRWSFTTEYKVEAAHRVIDSGRTIAEVARELGGVPTPRSSRKYGLTSAPRWAGRCSPKPTVENRPTTAN